MTLRRRLTSRLEWNMTTATRSSDLRLMLVERRRELHDDVQNRIRGARVDQSHDIGDHVDTSDAHVHGEIEFALVRLPVAAFLSSMPAFRPRRRGTPKR